MQAAQLQQQSTGLPVQQTMASVSNGNFKKVIDLRQNDIVFLRLIKMP
jgi:hypothetical protein